MPAVTARALGVAAIAVICAVAPAPADATPAQELDRARELFRAGNYAAAIPALNYLLYPSPRLSQPEDLVEAHVLLAVSAFETGDRKTARRELEEAWYLDRGLALDTLLFSAAAVDFWDDVKADLEERERRDAEQRRLAEENERLQRVLESMIVIETRPFYVNFIPFGAGQFQNDQRGKGLFFAVSQGITGAISAGIWLYLVGEYGLPGRVPPEEVDAARRLQQIEIGAGALCLGLMAWGIVDSLLHYQPSVRREPDPSLLPPDLRRLGAPDAGPDAAPDAAAPPRPPEARLHLSPRLFFDEGRARGAGLSLTWEY